MTAAPGAASAERPPQTLPTPRTHPSAPAQDAPAQPLAPPAPVAPAVPAAPAANLPPKPAPGDAGGLWARVAAFVADKPARRAMISQMRAVAFDGTRAVIGCPPRAVDAARAQSRALAELLQAVLERPVQVTIEPLEGEPAEAPGGHEPAMMPMSTPSAPPPPARPLPGRAGPDPELLAAVQDHPLVRRAADLFSARIRDVRATPVDGPG